MRKRLKCNLNTYAEILLYICVQNIEFNIDRYITSQALVTTSPTVILTSVPNIGTTA